MKKYLLLLIIILITGCNKYNIKYIELDSNKNINVVTSLDYENKDHYIKEVGFINSINSKIVVKDINNKIVDISNNKVMYNIRNINYSHRYYKIYTSPINYKINNKYKKNEYNIILSVQITNPLVFCNKDLENMNTLELYNKYIKNVLNKNLNKALSKINKEELNELKLTEELNKLVSKKLDKSGISITIEHIEFIN